METQSLYGVEYTLLEPLPAQLAQDEQLLIGLQLRNSGLTPWMTSGCLVLIVVRWTTPDGQVVRELPWQPLPHPVPVGECVTVELSVVTDLPPASYLLTVELVEDQVAWFRDREVPPFTHPITVVFSDAPRITILNGNCLANDAVGTHVASQVRALAAAGFRPLLLTAFIDQQLPRQLRRFMVAVNPHHILQPDEQSRFAAQHFRRSAAVIVNYSSYYDLVELIRAARAPVLFDYHGITPPAIWGIGNPGYEDVMRGVANLPLARFADYAVAHSQYMVDELVATGLVAPSRASVQPYPVVTRAAYAEPPDPALQNQYQLHGKTVLLYVGRMARNKRVHILVEALPLIRQSYPEAVLLLVGETAHVYAGYVAEVKARATELGITDAVIFTGPQSREKISDFYRLCDVYVTASIHEGFCMPVIEAMALGKPVVAAAATALPDTVGDAGLLFTPDDPIDLAQQVIKVLTARNGAYPDMALDLAQARQMLSHRPIAFVTPRYGRDVLGGAERGAQAWAEQLAARGLKVEVLTTNAVDLIGWQTGSLPETEEINGVVVRRFPVDLVHPGGFHEVQMKAARGETITRQDEERFMQHNLRSRALEAYIADHRDHYAAFIFTPYLFGTAYYAAQQAGDRAFHIPCLHDEPAAQFSVFREMLEEARGIFFNSPAEEQLARAKLKLANPWTAVFGYGFEEQPLQGDPARFRARTGVQSPFLLYSGRLEEAKNVPLLVEWFVAFKDAHPESELMLVLAGKGDLSLPDRPDIVRIGMIVDRQELADAYASCLALCQLSLNESFSIVMMEAWQQRRPVIVHADCAVTSDHVARSGGGYVCRSSAEFSAVIERLIAAPAEAVAYGERGYHYVSEQFGWNTLVERFIVTLATWLQPRPLLAELAQRGIRRALNFTYGRFEAHLIGLLRQMLAQYPDWRLIDQVYSQMAQVTAQNGRAEHDHLSSTRSLTHWFRQVVRRARPQSHVSVATPVAEPVVMVEIIAGLLDLLAQSRHDQRRLERELIRLRDQLTAAQSPDTSSR